jgi:hypothetical protein
MNTLYNKVQNTLDSPFNISCLKVFSHLIFHFSDPKLIIYV